jgi:hypothetical protein
MNKANKCVTQVLATSSQCTPCGKYEYLAEERAQIGKYTTANEIQEVFFG